jgi:aminoglycoside phosphotransferase (APT) family kinase protein
VTAIGPVAREVLTCELGTQITAVRVEPFDYRTSHPLYALDVDLADGRRVRVLAKDTARPHPARPPRAPGNRSTERLVYELLLGHADGSVPRFFGTAGSLLVLERVEGSVLWQLDGAGAWLDVARCLRSLHESLAEGTAAAFLPRYDTAWYEHWLERATRQVGTLPATERMHATAVECLLAQPPVVIHGELYPSNVLVAGRRVCIVDWETAAVGPAAVDVAALSSGWGEAVREEIAAAYGEIDRRALHAARLHLALRWLGWSPSWIPPVEHRVDWKAEAERAAHLLGEASA